MDILIQNGLVADGTGARPQRLDISIERGKITAIGRLGEAEAAHRIDASGLLVAPGFIDIHTHSDLTLVADPRAQSSVRQGVTTEVIGQCGFSAAPVRADKQEVAPPALGISVKKEWGNFAEYLDRLARDGLAHNVASFVGHSTIREYVMGYSTGTPTPAELTEMKFLLSCALEEGAFGLSSGLEYPPGMNATTRELIELCKLVAQHNGIYASHIRDMNEGVLDATRELIGIADATGLHVHHSHLGSFFPAEDLIDDVIALMEQARDRGVEVTGDATMVGVVSSYPEEKQRPSGYTMLSTILPPWAFEGGAKKLAARLRNPELRKKLKQYKKPKFRQILEGKWDGIYLHYCKAHRGFINKTLAEIAAERRITAHDAALDLLLEEFEATGNVTSAVISGRTTSMNNVRKAVKWAWSSISSDSYSVAPDGPTSALVVQPNAYGNFPCLFRKFVRNEKLLTLEEAIRKCTFLPAQQLGLTDRGLLKEGKWADVVVFDPEAIEDMATYEHREEFAKGIYYVLVNGEIVVDAGKSIDCYPGRILRK